MSWAKDPVCYGSEGQLSDCRFSQFGEDVSCAANETINVYCEREYLHLCLCKWMSLKYFILGEDNLVLMYTEKIPS